MLQERPGSRPDCRTILSRARGWVQNLTWDVYPVTYHFTFTHTKNGKLGKRRSLGAREEKMTQFSISCNSCCADTEYFSQTRVASIQSVKRTFQKWEKTPGRQINDGSTIDTENKGGASSREEVCGG